MQRPLIHFDEHTTNFEVIRGALREYVDQRGVCFHPTTVRSRRPRTLFFSPGNFLEAKDADVIWYLPGGDTEWLKKPAGGPMDAPTMEDDRTVREISIAELEEKFQRFDYTKSTVARHWRIACTVSI
eukprot:gnl/TRDRNA2_/TRDRNA2_4157_c0_seq1.p1 gnl/TRDRNA2_/TRDRNA2_4157_c0~~gnl/TRDRNA2_/TRDRNA2_4157_c0_seq1.p1  ORF type:complete len:127 (-),score=10.21 gnl/TRDRNA2_/TRDRNA2_4157_c0_seq1:124-504(-)